MTSCAVLVADSRSFGFWRYPQDPDAPIRYVVQRGAVIKDLRKPALDLIKTLTHETIIVKIAAGINELTSWWKHSGGKELTLSAVSSKILIEKLLKFKQEIHVVRPDALVGFVTIPTISFEKFNDLQTSTGKLWTVKQSKSELKVLQTKLDEILHEVNSRLKVENCKRQLPHKKGCRTVSWHNSITTRSKKRTKKGHFKLVYKNNFTKLYDGVHGVSELKKKWFCELCKAISAEIRFTAEEKYSDTTDGDNASEESTGSESEGDCWDFKRR